MGDRLMSTSLLEVQTDPDVPPSGSVTFWVAGHPVQQGSMNAFVVAGKARVVHKNPSGLQLWRSAIADEARKRFASVSTDAVAITAAFVLQRPKSHPKGREKAHITAPDIDKLGRSVLDAMSGVVYADDRQVNSLTLTKRYAMLHEQTGVLVTVSR